MKEYRIQKYIALHLAWIAAKRKEDPSEAQRIDEQLKRYYENLSKDEKSKIWHDLSIIRTVR